MKVIILSAGQGSRLLPHTANKPKCLLPLANGYNLLKWQLTRLDEAGVDEAVVVTGFNAEMVESEVAQFKGKMTVRTRYNPFYCVADNLSTVWMVRDEMDDGPFMILNGDTLFTTDVATTLINNASAPITLATSEKSTYDDDDMKIIRNGRQLLRVGKKLLLSEVNAESIGFMLFQGDGAVTFKNRVEEIMQTQQGLKVFYLSVIDSLATEIEIGTADVPATNWGEVDFPEDYDRAKELVASWDKDSEDQANIVAFG